jgi:glycosyltransferase involved in cell wall biosynthesis
MGKTHIGFIIEQALGHVTHGQNLQKNVAADPEIVPHWGLPQFPPQGIGAKIPVYKSNWTVRAGWQARRMVARMPRPLDVLFFHTQVTAVLAADWLRRIPGVVSLDATPIQYDSLGEFYAHGQGPAWLENIKFRLNRNCFQAARRLVSWTDWAHESLVNDYGVDPAKITTIPPGVNSADWRRPEVRGPAAPNAPVRILFVGGNLARKGGDELLAAFRRLREVVTVGGEDRSPVELHLVTKDQVAPEPGLFVYNDMTPNSERLKQLYFDSDIFCLPTHGDCLPMVLSEAGAAGLPVVSTAVAGIPEIVQEGETGFLIPAGDTDALTEALQNLIAHPQMRLEMGEKAVKRVSAQFDAQRNADRLLALLKAVAKER